MGTISTETQQLAEAVRLACIELRTKINGNVPTLAALNTTAKGSLVAAINEVLALAGDGGEPAWADITGKPAAVTALSGTNTGDQDISGKLDISTAASTYAPLAGGRVFTGTTNFENTVVFESHTSFGVGALDAIGTTINFGSGTTFAFSSGAASSMRTALGLGALATSTDAANLTGNIAVARIASALNAGGNPISCTTVTASGAVTITSGNFYIGTTASPDVRFFGSLSNHRSNHVIAWTSGNANATEDTGLSRKHRRRGG